MPCALRQKTFVRRRLFASVAPPEGRLELHSSRTLQCRGGSPHDAPLTSHSTEPLEQSTQQSPPTPHRHKGHLCLTQHLSTAPSNQVPTGEPLRATPMCTWYLSSRHTPLNRWCKARTNLLQVVLDVLPVDPASSWRGMSC